MRTYVYICMCVCLNTNNNLYLPQPMYNQAASWFQAPCEAEFGKTVLVYVSLRPEVLSHSPLGYSYSLFCCCCCCCVDITALLFSLLPFYGRRLLLILALYFVWVCVYPLHRLERPDVFLIFMPFMHVYAYPHRLLPVLVYTLS